MKKYLCLGLILVNAAMLSAQSNKVRLNGYINYVFDEGFNSYYDSYSYYEGTINGGAQWGIGIEYMAKPAYGVELLFLRQGTTAPTVYRTGQSVAAKQEDFQLGINYLMIAGNRYVGDKAKKVEGVGGFMIGIGIMDIKRPSDGSTGNATKFAWGLRLGANIWASQRIAIKFQAQLTSIAQGAGGGFYFGTGGASAGVSAYSSIYQFGLGGGLVFALGQDGESQQK
jgi:hypothetical protein